MTKKTLVNKQSIKIIEDNITKLEKCISIYNQIIERIKDEDIKKVFILQKNDIIHSVEVSKIALNNAKKVITLMTNSNNQL